VNLLADVLHTFYVEAVIPEFSSGLLLSVMFIVATFVALVLAKKRRIFRF